MVLRADEALPGRRDGFYGRIGRVDFDRPALVHALARTGVERASFRAFPFDRRRSATLEVNLTRRVEGVRESSLFRALKLAVLLLPVENVVVRAEGESGRVGALDVAPLVRGVRHVQFRGLSITQAPGPVPEVDATGIRRAPVEFFVENRRVFARVLVRPGAVAEGEPEAVPDVAGELRFRAGVAGAVRSVARSNLLAANRRSFVLVAERSGGTVNGDALRNNAVNTKIDATAIGTAHG